MGDDLKLSGSPIATTYERDGETFAHHVREIDGPALGAAHACIEHTITNCVNCGRTPGEQRQDDKAKDRYMPEGQSHEALGEAEKLPPVCRHTKKRPACKCTLVKAPA